MITKNNTRIFYDGLYTNVMLHETIIVKFNDDYIKLNTDGWKTATTKNRMNQTAQHFNLGFNVYQKNYTWYVDHNNKTFEYYDGMKLNRWENIEK